MNISILLPYKENYSKQMAGAVSLFVKDTSNVSCFKKNITIFGSTNSRKFLSDNYENLKSKKKFLQSANKEYVKSFLKHPLCEKTDILEIHNRPNYIKQIKETYKNKIFLYFHNDPLSMNGSRTESERDYLIRNVDKIIFNSNWSRNRFFLKSSFKDLIISKSEICYQSTSKVSVNFRKKKNIITFIGKLNSAKGFDIFGKTIIKILDKYKDWKAYVIGDEPREKMYFKHKNIVNLGFKNNQYILNFLKSVRISVVCSRWEEPFGRTSLEAASRGSAVIIGNRGGLPETSKSAIILKSLDVKNLYKEISFLIENKNKLQKVQKSNLKDFFLTHSYVTNILDNIRKKFIINKVNLKNKKILKIMHITNFNYRFEGRLHYNTGRRLNNGFVRLGHNVLTVSDRDILHNKKSINDFGGTKSLQQSIIKNYNNFKPDLVILGHADNVSNDTLNYIKKNNTLISQWFLDPLSRHGPDYSNNKNRVLDKAEFIDATFLTTDPESLDFNIEKSFYLPNPCDQSFEILDNFSKNCDNDLFFAMSHGVHRGELKKGKKDDREIFIKKLIKLNQSIKFDIYGMLNSQPIWADNFLNKVGNSSMGLNLSRGRPIKYYSSDRLAQLMGNGLLTFIDRKTKFNDFFSDKEIIFYNNIDDLSYKLNKYKKDKKQRKLIAKNGKKKYFKYFNSTLVSDYIIKQTLDIKNSKNFLWVK
ncbi:glycosyltransferase [Pelagibacterales bacterium SAG-MED47]|nr:glycosyltransferase [Pelagibacterales bacterium SAG-MED47]